MDGIVSDSASSIEPRPRRLALRSALSKFLRLAIGIGVLAFLFTRVPISEVLLILRQSDLRWILLGFSASVLVQWIAARRLKIIADLYELRLTHMEVFQINLASRFYGLFLPGGNLALIAIRIFKLGQIRKRYGQAIIAMGMDRLFATLALTLVGVGFWVLDWPAHSTIWMVLMVGAFLGLAVLLIAMSFQNRWEKSTLVQAALSHLPVEPSRNFRAALNSFMAMPKESLFRMLTVSVLSHVFGVASYVALAASLDLNIGLFAIGWIHSAMILATMLPVSVAGLGLREGAALLTLTAYGITAEEALAFSLLVFTVTTLLIGLLGGMMEGWRFLTGSRGE